MTESDRNDLKRLLRIGIFALMAASFALGAAMFSGCAAPQKATAIRERLAADTSVQLRTSATEYKSLVEYTIQQKSASAFSELSRRYNARMNQILLESDLETSASLASKVATLSADYFASEARLKASLESESRRLLVGYEKIDASADAVNAINDMATSENSIAKATVAEFTSTGGAMDAIIKIIEETSDKYRPAELDGSKEKN